MNNTKIVKKIGADVAILAKWLDGMKTIGSLHEEYDEKVIFYIRLGATIKWCEEMQKRVQKIMTREEKKEMIKFLKTVKTT